ncbi:MAG: aminofutalosine synthase MqnE [Actinobacteria bacterium]|nr:MAG: aminofutalosine synthase MqnE [Actinomycetota bacterium]
MLIKEKSVIAELGEKVVSGGRLTKKEALKLYKSNDILTLGYYGRELKKQKTGDKVFFITNRHINHTNICLNRCKFCAFSRDENEPDAYVMSIEEVVEKGLESAKDNISELHIVGGCHPTLPYSYYLDMIRELHKALPSVHIQAFTAVEIDYFAQISNKSIHEVLAEFKDVGLGSLPGGGAEIFSERTRALAWEKKVGAARWLEIMEAAHNLGINSNATMLYGHIETLEERIDHMMRLRDLQDKTGGFKAFIPLAFHPMNTELDQLSGTTGYEDIKTLAVARLVLDNFDHIKAFWIMIGPKLAQVSLQFGVDDIDGTVVEEKITHSAGAETEEYIEKNKLIHLIKDAGYTPVERDTLYNELNTF